MASVPPPIPVLGSVAWPSVKDLNAIHDLVDRIVENLASDRPPIDHRAGFKIRDCSVRARGGVPSHARDIRAALVTVKGANVSTIELENFPRLIEEADALVRDLPAFRLAIAPVLAHETTHIVQRDSGLVSAADCDRAQIASEAVNRDQTFAAYEIYVREPMELAAHSVQLAVEILLGHGLIVDDKAFRRRAAQTWVYRHMLHHPQVGERYEIRQEQTLRLLKDVVEQARWFHKTVVDHWPPR